MSFLGEKFDSVVRDNETVILVVILVLLVVIFWHLFLRGYKMSVSIDSFTPGSTLANLAGSVRDDTGFVDSRGIDGLGQNERPAFWAPTQEMADSRATVAEVQKAESATAGGPVSRRPGYVTEGLGVRVGEQLVAPY
jgi:hypothetical protein